MRHGLRWKWSALVAVSAVAVSGVLGLRAAPPAAPMSGPTTPPKPDGLDFRVSEGRAVATESSERLPEAPATRLSDAEAERLLSRLEPVKVVPEDTTDFRVREESVPPPRAGRTIDTTFPPPAPATPPAVDPGPLAVVRVAPQGDVPVLDRITVTFNQPMVPVSSVDTVSRVAPVELTPKVEGNWRWLGTRTVVFDPGSGKRLPMATVFRATVPAGTRSASGAILAEAVSVEVRTPAPRVVASGPAGPGIARTPIVWMAFDQRIDAPALAGRLQWLANGVKPRVRLATEAEIGKAPGIPAAGDVPRDRLLAVVVLEPLPADTGVAVRLPKGAPSAEGPRTTDNDHLVQFRTYASLKLVRGQCGWNDQAPCRPEDPWRIEFNNPLDAEAFDPAWVTVSPKVPGSEPTVQGNNLFLGGMRKGRTQYTVSISPRLRDIHGQTLGASDAVVFKVGPAAPNLLPPPGGFQVADPAAPPRIEFQSVNLRRIAVQVRAVDPDDWEAWTTAQENPEGKANWPGRVVIDRALIPGGDNDAWTRSSLDLSAALVNGRGNVIVTWSAVLGSKALPEGERTVRGASWIQSTRIGLSVHADPTDLLAWATDLATGKPLPGAKVRLAGTGTTVATGADGLARFDLGPTPARRIEVRVGDDIAFLPARFWRWDDGGWRRQQRVAALRWYAFDDRGLYKPGETVRVKGWLRRQEPGKAGPLTIPADIKSMPWSLRDAVGNEVAKGTTRLNAWGGFDLSVALPKTMNLGDAFLQVGDFGRQVKVQEFRRPEFEVAARSETEGPHVVGGVPAEVSVKAAYYAGGGLAGAATHWSVTARKARYSPPGHDGFTFGEWRPWWIRDAPEFGGDVVFARGRMAGGGHPFEEPGEEKTFDGATDPSGVHRVRIDFDAVRPARPYTVHAQATVQDVNRQALAATTDLLVHPSERYVGVRSERTFVEEGKPYGFEAIACGIDGAMDAGRTLRFRAFRRVSRWSKGRFTEVEADPIAWTVASGKGPVRTEFTPKTGGVWTLEAVVEDAKGRPNRTVTTVWVTGGPVESQRDLAKETVELIPAKQVHAPGETATVLVRAPFAPAEGLLTLRHNGFVRTERFTMTGRTRVLRFPVVGDWMPNVEVQVDLTGAAPRVGEDGKPVAGAKPRPAYASGNLSLDVETKARRLVVSARPAEARVEPGGKTSVEVAVQGADGKPVPGAEVALVVVDEAVLALAGWDPGDPLAALLPRVPGDVQDWYLRDHVRLEDPARVLDSSGAAGGAMPAAAMPMMVADGAVAEGRAGGGRFLAKAVPRKSNVENAKAESAGEASDPIRVRSNFEALAHYTASAPTGADGRVVLQVELPDNLTRYRIFAVAAHGSARIGKGESALTARLPLMARVSAPRFLNFGDRCELPVTLQNQTDAAMTVDVAVRATNARLVDGAGRRVRVAANDRVEVRFPVTTASAGTARFQVAAATGGGVADAAEVSLPVWTPATSEAFATYGVIDDGAVAQPIVPPGDAFAEFGGLEVSTASTALQELTDAWTYLNEYPYGCAEQIASRVLANVALRDVLAAFKAPGFTSVAAVDAQVRRDLARLSEIQNDDGSFGFWARGERPWPWLGVHVAHAVAQSERHGIAPPALLATRSRDYVKAIDRHFPSDYPVEARRFVRAAALQVRHVLGDTDRAGAAALLGEAELDVLGPEVAGLCLQVLAGDAAQAGLRGKVRAWFDNHVVETAGAAHFAFSYRDAAYLVLHSDRRADAIVLEALMADDPKQDLIPKLVRGLLDGRRRGMWMGTQENAYILLALDRYFRTYEGTTPNFVARVWLGNDFAGMAKFEGRSADRAATRVAMRTVMGGGTKAKPLVISKEGPGRLYYRIGMKYAPKSLALAPLDQGFQVRRTYEPVTRPTDVVRGADGTWTVKAGALVRVRVTMVTSARRYHVALVDPLPAGFEALNPELKGTERVSQGAGAGKPAPWFWWRWYDHVNLRDERAEAFASLLWEGAHEYVYVCRATTPGTFVVPPVKAEEMYAPETFGRGATETVVVR